MIFFCRVYLVKTFECIFYFSHLIRGLIYRLAIILCFVKGNVLYYDYSVNEIVHLSSFPHHLNLTCNAHWTHCNLASLCLLSMSAGILKGNHPLWWWPRQASLLYIYPHEYSCVQDFFLLPLESSWTYIHGMRTSEQCSWLKKWLKYTKNIFINFYRLRKNYKS